MVDTRPGAIKDDGPVTGSATPADVDEGAAGPANVGTAFSDEGFELLRAAAKIPELPKANPPIEQPAPPGEVINYPTPATTLPSKPSDDPRTVVVLDDYRNTDILLKGDLGFSHGELSARMAEENGFSVVRIQLGLQRPGIVDIPGALAQLDQAVENGTLKLGKGDVVNISFGLEKSFVDASQMLGIEITPENLRERRDEILQAVKEKADDPHTPKATRGYLNQVIAINEGIAKLQERGIEVVTGGGNSGPDHFNLGLLSADKHYSATTADGLPAAYSARNSLTTDGRGDVDFYAMPVNAYDPTPIGEQTGSYRIDGTDLYVSAKDFGGMLEGPYLTPQMKEFLFFNDDHAATFGLTGINPDGWLTGNFTLSVQGTSFVNGFRLPIEHPSGTADSDVVQVSRSRGE